MAETSYIDRDTEREETFSRRAFIIGLGQAGLLTLLCGRLVWLQVAQGTRYKTLAENNRINVKIIAPSRGQIVDRFGVPLAVNNQNFRALIVPEQTDNLEHSLRTLATHIDLKESDIGKLLKQARQSRSFAPLEISDRLTWDDVARVEVNLPDLPGVSIDEGEIRHYPFGDATAHIIGYVGRVAKSDQTEDDPLLSLPGFRVGKSGLEKFLDRDLRGRSGSSQMEVNVVGREVRELKKTAPVPGQRMTLSLDAELQRYAQNRMIESKSASAVIMDAHTGAVYALASYPSFDPNHFTRGIPAEKWEELLADPTFPLTNKALAGQYPPGSTFKMVTALAGLEQGTINAHNTVSCPGHYTYGDTKFHCWKPSGHGTMNVVTALRESCDTYFYKISTDVGIDRIAAMARRLGLGDKTGLELAEERPGLMPDQQWKKSKMGQGWQAGETIVSSIGQGYILATPLQLAVMTARLVNGGFAVKPWLVSKIGDQPQHQSPWPSLGIKPKNLEIIKQGMDQVVGHERGTARGAQIPEEGFEMGGKTGTAQVKRITKQERAMGIKNETLAWKYRHHALFVGYAPAQAPRYVCCVVVEHGGGGSAVAAPIARDLLLMAQKRNPESASLATGMEVKS
jgi:penicillin-binding protein 2